MRIPVIANHCMLSSQLYTTVVKDNTLVSPFDIQRIFLFFTEVRITTLVVCGVSGIIPDPPPKCQNLCITVH